MSWGFFLHARILCNPIPLLTSPPLHFHSSKRCLLSRLRVSVGSLASFSSLGTTSVSPNMPGVDSEVVDWPANRVRDTFINFFEEKSHVNWRSSPVVPHNDPTLLFANAGAVLISLSASVWFLRKRRKMWKLDWF